MKALLAENCFLWLIVSFLAIKTVTYFCINHRDQRCFFHFKIIMNVLVSSFRIIWIPVAICHGLTAVILLYTSESDVYSQILTYKDGPRTERVYGISSIQNMLCGVWMRRVGMKGYTKDMHHSYMQKYLRNPLTASAAYIRVFIFLCTLCTTFWTCLR